MMPRLFNKAAVRAPRKGEGMLLVMATEND